MERYNLIRYLADEARHLVLRAESASDRDGRAMVREAGELIDLAARVAAHEDHYEFKTQEAA